MPHVLPHYLTEAWCEYIALYDLGQGVIARVPTSARSLDGANAEAAEHAAWIGVQVEYVYWNLSDGIALPLRVQNELEKEGKTGGLLDFFSTQELYDFVKA